MVRHFQLRHYCTDVIREVKPAGLDFSEFCPYSVGMETKRGRGRPPKDPAGTKGERVEFRAGESEKQLLERAASSAGLSVSDWAREVLLRAAKRAVSK